MFHATVEKSSVYELNGWLWYFLTVRWRFTDLIHLLESLSRYGLQAHFVAFVTENEKLSPCPDEIPLLKTGKNFFSEYNRKKNAIIVFMIYTQHLCIQNNEELCSVTKKAVITLLSQQ